MLQTLKDIGLSFCIAVTGLALCLIGGVIICIPLVLCIYGLCWCLSTATGMDENVALIWVCGSLAVFGFTTTVYLEKKKIDERMDEWLADIVMKSQNFKCIKCNEPLNCDEEQSSLVEGELGWYCSQECWFDVEGPVNHEEQEEKRSDEI